MAAKARPGPATPPPPPVERRWPGDLLALLAGGALPLAFAPFHLAPLAWLSPALLFLLWREATPRTAFRRGFVFGLGMFGVGVSWIYVAIHDFGHTSALIAGPLTLLFVAFISLFPALQGWVTARLRPFSPGQPVTLLLLFPLLWTLFEWIRSETLTGFPWLSLGYSQIDTPLAGFAPVVGVFSLSWAAATTAAALAWLWLVRGRGLALAAALLVLLWGGGALLQQVEWTTPSGAPMSVALVQGNTPQVEKWDPERIQMGLDRYASLSLPLLGRVQLVVWPENAVTMFYQDLAESYFAPLERVARERGSDMVMGVPLLHENGVDYFTTMMSLGTTHAFYAKRHLVPFGEFVPLEGVLRGLIGFFDLPMSGFSPGAPHQPPLELAGHKAAVSICYEDVFGDEVIDTLPAATLLINGSNNAWYGDSFAPHQHLQIARMRALETGRPLLRATTNGISAIVDHRGAITARSPQFAPAVIEGRIQPMSGATPFVRWGNGALLLLLALAMVGVVAPRLLKGGATVPEES